MRGNYEIIKSNDGKKFWVKFSSGEVLSEHESYPDAEAAVEECQSDDRVFKRNKRRR